MQYNVISADDHLDMNWLPRDLWQSRVPSNLRQRAPRVEDTAEGPVWLCDGAKLATWGPRPRSVEGRPDAFDHAYDRERLRPSNPKLRLEDMDRDGVDASVIFGPSSTWFSVEPELNNACQQAYNDWLAEFCAAAPERLLGVGLLSKDDPAAAAAEVRRLARIGVRQAMFVMAKADPPVYEPEWDVLWEAACETGVQLSSHFFIGVDPSPRPPKNLLGHEGARMTLDPVTQLGPLAGLIFAGVFERFPRLMLHVAETGIGWVPFALQRMDHCYKLYQQRREYWETRGGFQLTKLPSEYFKAHIRMTYQEDSVGLRLLPLIGEDIVMWASDYPHPDSTWPRSQQTIQEELADLSEPVRRKVLIDTTPARCID